NNTGTLIVPALSNAIGFNLSELSGTSSNRLTNSGHITAHNGFVTLSSDALDIITGSAINNSGIIDISIQPGNTSGGVVEINASQGTLRQNGNILATGGDIPLQSDNIHITSPVELIADKGLLRKKTAASGGILSLRADAHITADSTIDLSEFSIIGAGDGVSLTLETNANESTIQLNTIQIVGELTATAEGTLILAGDIQAAGNNLTLQSDNIRITNPVELIADKVLFKKSTDASGGILNLRADAHITADSTIDLSEFSIIGAGDGVSLTLDTNANESTIQLNSIHSVRELTATTEGTLALAGNIQAAGNNLTLNAGTIQLDSDILIRN